MYYFIVNLTSRTGKTKEIWEAIQKELLRREVRYEVCITEGAGHARELADRFCTRAVAYKKEQGRTACLVVVGGDGTANEVVNGMHHLEDVHFGYIPTGSGNDLGRGLGISKDPVEALEGLLNASEAYPMDLGKVTDSRGHTSYFAISSGIGIDADVVRLSLHSRLKKFLNRLGLGSMTYVLLTIKALFTMPTTEVCAKFDGGRTKRIPKMIFVAGMNHPWEGGGVPMAPKASARDGKLSVCCVYGIPRWRTFFLLPRLVAGKQEGIKGFEILECESYELTLAKPMALHQDGEYLGQHTAIRYGCEKGRLLVRK